MTQPPLTGPEAIRYALENLDTAALEEEQRKVIRDKKKTARPRAVRILRIMEGMKRNKQQPADMMIHSVPVIPPKFRPFSVTGNTFLPGDSNELYRDLMEYRRLYDRTEKEFGRSGANDVYRDLTSAVKAVYGYGDSPNPKTRSRAVKGFFESVTGTSPKTSFYQSRMLSKPMDNVGRGVIVPDADLDMNQIGLPEEMAWKLYANYVQRSLVRGGMSPAGALKHVLDRTPQARQVLDKEMPDRPVVVSRSPAWHRFSVVGQIPRIVEGDAIRVNNYATEGWNADYDGDEQVNTVFAAIDYNLQLQNSWTDLGSCASNPDMFRNLLIPTLGADKRVIITDLEDFPRAEHGYSKEGKNGPIHFHTVPAGTQVIAMDETTGQAVWADVAFFSEHPGRIVEIVKLTNRKQIFTDDDPRAVYGVAGDDPEMRFSRFTPTEALARKVCVPIIKRPELPTTETSVEIGGRSFELDYDLGYLLGAICGDGWWDKTDYEFYQERNMFADTRAIQLSDLKGHVASRIHEILQAKFSTRPIYSYSQKFLKEDNPTRYGDTVKYTYGWDGSSELVLFLDEHLGGTRCDKSSGSANKHLPGFAYTAPKEFREGLVNGLMDTDGTCCVSNAKDKPQLMCAFSSTSLRLVREFSAICRTLGVTATVSFSKETSGGNTSWITTLSTVDAKKAGFLSRLESPWKRDAFVNTPVSCGGSEFRDGALFPRALSDLLSPWVTAPKILPHERGQSTTEYLEKVELQNLYQQFWNFTERGLASAEFLDKLEAKLIQRRSAAGLVLEKAKVMLRSVTTDSKFDQDFSDIIREAIRGVCPKQDTPERYVDGCRMASSVNRPLKEKKITPKMAKKILEWLEKTPRVADPLTHTTFVQWKRLRVEGVEWAVVESVEYTGKREDGYDLTVPGYETFMAMDGIVLSNTMSVHLPSSPEAVKDVKEKMMPDKMMWSIKNRTDVLAAPKHEAIVGLSLARSAGGTKRVFRSDDEAAAAISSGQVDLNDDIEIASS